LMPFCKLQSCSCL